MEKQKKIISNLTLTRDASMYIKFQKYILILNLRRQDIALQPFFPSLLSVVSLLWYITCSNIPKFFYLLYSTLWNITVTLKLTTLHHFSMFFRSFDYPSFSFVILFVVLSSRKFNDRNIHLEHWQTLAHGKDSYQTHVTDRIMFTEFW